LTVLLSSFVKQNKISSSSSSSSSSVVSTI